MINKILATIITVILVLTVNASEIKINLDPAAKQKNINLVWNGVKNTCPGINSKAVILGGKSKIVISLKDVLSTNQGAVSFYMKPINWTVDNKHFIFFITLSSGSGKSGQYLMFYKFFDRASVVLLAANNKLNQKKSGFSSIKHWRKPIWRKVILSWDKGYIKAYLDGKCIMVMPLPKLQSSWDKIILGPSRSWSHHGQELTAFSDLVIYDRSLKNAALSGKSKLISKSRKKRVEKNMNKKQKCSQEEEILSLAKAGAIPTASDSIENKYNYMADRFLDGKADTLWITGSDMRHHWAEISWHNRNITMNRVIASFKEKSFSWYKIDKFGTDPRKASKNYAVTSIPDEFKLSYRIGKNWHSLSKTAYKIHWLDNATILFDLKQPLQEISAVKLHFDTAKGDFAGLVNLKIIGQKTLSCYFLTPKWKNSTKWIWNSDVPVCAGTQIIKCYFRKTFEIKNKADIVRAKLLFAIHDQGNAWLNGKLLGHAEFTGVGIKQNLIRVDLPSKLFRNGKNVLAFEGIEEAQVGLSGILFRLGIEYKNNQNVIINSNSGTLTSTTVESGWKTQIKTFDKWKPAKVVTSVDRQVPNIWSFDYTPIWFKGEIKLEEATLIPENPSPGEKYTIKLKLKPESALPEDYNVIIKFGQECLAEPHRQFLGLGEAICSGIKGLPKGLTQAKIVTFTGIWPVGTPSYLAAQVLVCNSNNQAQFIKGPIGEISKTNNPGRLNLFFGTPRVALAKGFPVVKMTHGGRFSVDGKAVAPIIFSSSLLTMDRFQQYIDAGGRIFRIIPQGVSQIMYDSGNEEKHLERVLKIIENTTSSILQMAPDAKFLLLLQLDTSNIWNIKHQDDMITMSNGQKLLPRESKYPKFAFLRETPNSPAVIKRIQDGLQKFIKKLEQKPYAHSIIGFTLGHGCSGENYWGIRRNIYFDVKKGLVIAPRKEYLFGDFGLAARKDLSRWLKRKYKTDEKLAAAWKKPGLKFSDIESPDKWDASEVMSELMWWNRPKDKFMFRDSAQEGNMYHDFIKHQNLARAEVFEAAGKAIKKASANRLLVGGFIGYSVCNLTNSPPALAQHTGHLMVDILRKSPYFDFICSPHFYSMRRAGDPVITHGASESMRLHGKIWISEYDTRTYLSPIKPKTFSQKETREVMQKEFAYAITHGQGFWWLEFPFALSGRLAPAWFNDSDLIKDSKIMNKVYKDELQTAPKNVCAEVAVFINERQGFYTDAYSPGNTIHSNLMNKLLPKLYMSGTTFDLYAQKDLGLLIKRGLHKKYKMMIFLNAFHISSNERKLIDKHLKKDQRTLFFLFAPGYQGNLPKNNSELSVKGVTEVTNMRGVKKIDKQALVGIKFTSEMLKQLPGQSKRFTALGWNEGLQTKFYGNKFGPIFYLDNKENDGWKSLGEIIVDGNVNSDKTALAKKSFKDCTIVYSTVPNLPIEVLSKIIRDTGVHLYTQSGLLVYANDSFIAVHSGDAVSKCRIKAKIPVTWYEPFEKKEYAKNKQSIEIDLKAGETKFFKLK